MTTSHSKRRFRLYAAAGLAVAAALGLGAYTYVQQRPSALFNALNPKTEIKIGGPFSLIDQNGDTVTENPEDGIIGLSKRHRQNRVESGSAGTDM